MNLWVSLISVHVAILVLTQLQGFIGNFLVDMFVVELLFYPMITEWTPVCYLLSAWFDIRFLGRSLSAESIISDELAVALSWVNSDVKDWAHNAFFFLIELAVPLLWVMSNNGHTICFFANCIALSWEMELLQHHCVMALIVYILFQVDLSFYFFFSELQFFCLMLLIDHMSKWSISILPCSKLLTVRLHLSCASSV